MRLKRRKADNPPVTWSKKDTAILLGYLQTTAFDSKKLRKKFPKRSPASIRSKVRKLRIEHDLFGASYREEKESFTTLIAKKIKPKVVFDAYAGAGHQTLQWIAVADKVFASEYMKSKRKQFEKNLRAHGFLKLKTKGYWEIYKKDGKRIFFYSGDAVDAAAKIKIEGYKIDALDLDTCGSTLPALPTFLVLLKPKHVLITHGEFHSMRFKREDVLRRLLMHRDIGQNPLPMDVEQLSAELDKAVKIAALRAHNETVDSFWMELKVETWLGNKFHGMLRRHYQVRKPVATADCINTLSA